MQRLDGRRRNRPPRNRNQESFLAACRKSRNLSIWSRVCGCLVRGFLAISFIRLKKFKLIVQACFRWRPFSLYCMVFGSVSGLFPAYLTTASLLCAQSLKLSSSFGEANVRSIDSGWGWRRRRLRLRRSMLAVLWESPFSLNVSSWTTTKKQAAAGAVGPRATKNRAVVGFF